MRRGVLTSAAAGNSGLDLGNVCNVAPWMLSVAASSIDRWFVDRIVLGNGKTIVVSAETEIDMYLLRSLYCESVTNYALHCSSFAGSLSINTFPTLSNATLAFPANG
jgi:hypothetical protein